MQRYLGAVILILISVIVSFFYPQTEDMTKMEIPKISVTSQAENGLTIVRWQTLQKLDYKKNIIQDETLKSHLNQTVRIPGFAVPLTDNLQAVSEFLLVPN